MVKVTNNLSVAARIIKVNMYEVATIPAGGEAEVPLDMETVEIILEPST